MYVQPHVLDVLSCLTRSVCILGMLAFHTQFAFLIFSSMVFHIIWKYIIQQIPSSFSPKDLEYYSIYIYYIFDFSV